MPEKLEKLKSLLHELERELAQLQDVDEEASRLLTHVSQEIDHAIHQENPEALKEAGVTEQLRGRLEEFEASHPTLTAVVNRIADALGQLGI